MRSMAQLIPTCPTRRWILSSTLAGVLAGCSTQQPDSRNGATALSTAAAPLPRGAVGTEATALQWINRLTWGATAGGTDSWPAAGSAAFVQAQLAPAPARLAPALQARIDAMTISRTPIEELLPALEARQHEARAMRNEEDRRTAQQALQRELRALQMETSERFLLRALYAPQQLHEKMSWFWMNHFSVFAQKGELRALVADYEERAIRPHALGHFRELLGAVTRHPAMLRYLDNARNAVDRINENLARELMELHTLGVNGGYTQQDVQELARVLTGVGVSLRPAGEGPPRMRPALQPYYVRQGLFEFAPARHDWGAKTLLGRPLQAQGLAELDEALDRLARAPATARHVTFKLAQFFVGDHPSAELQNTLARSFERSNGHIATVLRTLFEHPEFQRSLGQRFRDPMQYVLAALRLAAPTEGPVPAVEPVMNWLQTLAQPLYSRPTPDGYPLDAASWSGSGQMVTRFDIARAISNGNALRPPDPAAKPAPPALQQSRTAQTLLASWAKTTRDAVAQARSAREWNLLFLSAPEFMYG